ncbi:MAG: mechanosensitive ion channel [Magnetococcales bacterium]|nr:mechanosensitive ion channel [Magnetococcales bacterium]
MNETYMTGISVQDLGDVFEYSGFSFLLVVLAFIVANLTRRERSSSSRLRLGLMLMVFLSLLTVLDLSLLKSLMEPLRGLAVRHYGLIHKLVLATWWFALAYTFNRLLERVVWEGILGNEEGGSTIPALLRDSVHVLVYLITLMILMAFIFDKSITALAATSGVFAFVVGYSAQNTIGEIFAGISLNLSPPFAQGDWVEINEEWCLIRDIDWRCVTCEDLHGNQLVFPNSVVARSPVRNASKPTPAIQRKLSFMVEYGAAPNLVIDLVNFAMAQSPAIQKHPAAYTIFDQFDDLGVRYSACYYIDTFANRHKAANQVASAIWYRLNRRGIRFSFNRLHAHIDLEHAERPVPGTVWREVEESSQLLEFFRAVPFFASLEEWELHELAFRAKRHIHGPQETLIHQKDKGDSLFLITRGEVDVFITQGDGEELRVATLGMGQTVGVMSLMTGEPRSATVRVSGERETVTHEVTKETLTGIVQNRPAVLQELAGIVAQMQQKDQQRTAKHQASREQQEKAVETASVRLAEKIRRWFAS